MSVVFWDFDGTLAYSESLWSGSVYKALLETDATTSVPFADIKKHMQYGFTWHTPEQDYSHLIQDEWWAFMNKHFYESYLKCGVSEGIALAATSKVRNIIKRIENYSLYDDTIATLQKVREMGHTNVILSNNYPDLCEVLDGLQISTYFDGVVISAREGYDKPRIELFEIAKERFPGNEYYMVGDSQKADILGGKNAGMRTILVHKGYSDEADFCFDDLYEIIEILSNNIIKRSTS